MQDTQPIHVYVVDDDPDHLMIIELAFQAMDQPTAVETVNDGESALVALQTDRVRPDLILLDINMTGLSGLAVLGRIKNDAHLKHIPVVMLTSSTLPEDIAAAYRLGASGYIEKGLYLHDLRAVLGNTLLYWSAMRRPAA